MVRILKTQNFERWMRKSKLLNQALHKAVLEMTKGLIDADLGKGVFKKRVPVSGHGKSGGARVLLATNKKDRWVFLYGFQKNDLGNITYEELEALQVLSTDLLELSEKQIDYAIKKRELLEVFYDGKA